MPCSSIIAVGTELLHGFTVDTNSSWLAARLFRRGFAVRRITVVGDDDAEIAGAVRADLARVELDRIFLCGGLGPTPDDRTYAALAQALDRPLVYDRATGAQMQNLLFRRQVAARRGTAELNAGNRKMAMVPAGALLLRNGPGMAPGLAFSLAGDRYLIALPGVPAELRALVENFVEPSYLDGGRAPTVAELHYEAAPESAFHDAMRSVGSEYPDLTIGSYPQTERGELILRVSGLDADRVRLALDALTERVSRYRPIALPT